eukprot:TRINITY_DN4163_c0_g1_i3.p1 TRINITY_DN4163_c0_g1~~TRINITY_DN4163_c0_g1_i3.p1  ORF type:complete len:716 (+),score=109.93 TRINITY_DN4163_c0_g1_i3:26-2149(+)
MPAHGSADLLDLSALSFTDPGGTDDVTLPRVITPKNEECKIPADRVITPKNEECKIPADRVITPKNEECKIPADRPPVSPSSAANDEGAQTELPDPDLAEWMSSVPPPEFASCAADDEGAETELPDPDLAEWMSYVSAEMNWRVVIVEFIGQAMYALLGPLCWPILCILYDGGTAALGNRGFWVRKETMPFFIVQTVMWGGLFTSLVTLAVYRPPEVKLVELKLCLSALFMRSITIAVKYAYVPYDQWTRVNTEHMPVEYIRSLLLLIAWRTIPAATRDFYTRLSLRSVLGDSGMWPDFSMQFMSWPVSKQQRRKVQMRVGKTTQKMLRVPTGKILRFNHLFRETAETCNVLEFQAAKGAGDVKADPTFEKAKLGGRLSVEAVFDYIVRSVVRRDTVVFRVAEGASFIVALAICFLPCILRSAAGNAFAGDSVEARIVIIGMMPYNLLAVYSSNAFILVAARDMWRRRAMLRSCAALLSFQDAYRINCPAEVKMLPILDLMDASTLHSWMKLRMLCLDFGRFFSLRIEAFATVFTGCALAMLADLLLLLHVPSYRESVDMNFTDLAVTGTLAISVLGSIVTLVALGSEVNGSTHRHSFLLNRQRLAAIAMCRDVSRRDPADRKEISSVDLDDTHNLAEVADFIDVLCSDIAAEHEVHPVKLIGLYCGYSLLSTIYVVPSYVISQVVTFCTDSDAGTDVYCTLAGNVG